jgi:hypothetical protein
MGTALALLHAAVVVKIHGFVAVVDNSVFDWPPALLDQFTHVDADVAPAPVHPQWKFPVPAVTPAPFSELAIGGENSAAHDVATSTFVWLRTGAEDGTP